MTTPISTPVKTPERTIQKRTSGGDNSFEARVVIFNDDHNEMGYVATCLARVLPGTSPDKGWEMMTQIHETGQCIVWQGMREVAELYTEQLSELGLDARVQ